MRVGPSFKLGIDGPPGTGAGAGAGNVPPPPQNPQPSVSGNVLDAKTGVPIAGATVRSGNLSTTTDASGSFVLAAVPPGSRVLLTITAANYADHATSRSRR
jgi:Carboxypeptidase regulatory-like domain